MNECPGLPVEAHICAGTRLCRLLSVFYDLSMLQRVVLQTVRPAATQCCNMQRGRPVLVAIGGVFRITARGCQGP